MNLYFLIVLADVFLVSVFCLQKKYQKLAGTKVDAVLTYNGLIGVFSAIIFFCINKFCFELTPFSFLMGVFFCIAAVAYTCIGFKIIEKGNVSLYTLFLMSGGMVVPFVYGVFFLNEQMSFLRLFGLVLIVLAIGISNFKVNEIDFTQLFLCFAVFLLNGIVSVVSKSHQACTMYEIVSPKGFVVLTSVLKAVMSFAALYVYKVTGKIETTKISLKPVIFIVVLSAACNGISYLFQLIGASSLPATVLYPLITGGTIIITFLAELVIFREKLSLLQWISALVCFAGTFMFL